MLFMGSSEFPDENEYDSYLSKHGGSSNAYTETEWTCYYFDVNRKFLKESLKRFSQFFVSPLVKAEAMEREVMAVDSEFKQALQSDSCRLQQLQCHTSKAGHPFNRFFWGNKKSLCDAMDKGVNLRELILNMFKEYYHGGLMKLAVIGGESLDTLQDWVIELFRNVKKGDSLVPVQQDGNIWEAGNLFWLEAVKDVHVLNITWTLPCLHEHYLKRPEDYLAHLIGHEANGSLYSFLKIRGWASSLYAGVSDDGLHRSSISYTFVLSISLTDSGLVKVLDVVGVVYQYLKVLRQAGPQKWVFDELQAIGKMEFRFAEEQPQDDYATELAENALLYPEEHVIYGDYAFEVWDDKLVEHVLSFLTPDNMRIDILTKSFKKKSLSVQYEPWFGSAYGNEAIPPSLICLWRDPPELEPSLHLPAKNEFIPYNFSLRSESKNLVDMDLPKCILDGLKVKFWYKLDKTFNVPRANTYFLITVKDSYNSVRQCVLTELFMNLLRDELNEILYQASVAKLESSLSIVGDKLELKLFGFNDKLPILLGKILSKSRMFLPTADRFQVIKEDMERAFRNTNMKPMNHSSYLRMQLLREYFWHVDDKLSCLNNLSIVDLEAFIPKIFSQLYIEGLCHGNLLEEEAIEISKIFGEALSLDSIPPLPSSMWHKERVLCLPAGANFIRNAKVKNEMEVNSVVELYFQLEQDVGIQSTTSIAMVDLFAEIFEERFFDQLRTKEQLGYVVESGPRMTYRISGFCFRVQSSQYNPSYLQGRIDQFIHGVEKILEEIDTETFDSYRNGLIAKKLEKAPSLVCETNRYWNQIVDKRYLFDMAKKEAEALENIQKSDVVEWYRTYLVPTSRKCRRLAIHLWGCNANFQETDEKQPVHGKVIDDISAFQLLREFYPSLC
ncbi:nardilysin-like isoform X2 [Nymphaea colorata]|nr:nardilysin-like isoform X2 [Nymphaea colorata]